MSLGSHGDVLLSGKIPGSTSAKVDSLNTVTIGNTCHKILPILENDEEVSKCNIWDVARELNSYNSLGIRLHSREEDDVNALRIFNSKLFYNSDGQPVVGFPWIDDISPSQEELGSNFGLVKSRFDAVMKSLDKNPVKLAQYEKVHIKEVENNFVELVRAPATKSILQPIGGDTWKEGQTILLRILGQRQLMLNLECIGKLQ